MEETEADGGERPAGDGLEPATEPSLELVERFQPNLLPLAEGTTGHRSFLNCDKLKQAAGWEHRATWRG